MPAALNNEAPPERYRQEEADGPKEIEEDHVSAAGLWGQELGEQGGVHDGHPSEGQPSEQTKSEHAPRVPSDRGQGRGDRIPEDARKEDGAAAAIVSEGTQGE